jgi:hypothetical protein
MKAVALSPAGCQQGPAGLVWTGPGSLSLASVA